MFRSCYAHVRQINPLLPFFDIFSGTHVRPSVQVATLLAGNVTFVQCFTLFPAPRGKLGCYNTHPYGPGVSLEDFPKLVSIINNRYGSLTNAIAGSQSPLISVLDGKYPGMGMQGRGY